MNLEIFKNPDPSGRMSKESFLFKNHREEYDYIIEFCGINKIFDIPFKEKVYLCLNGIKSVQLCKNTNCNNKVKFKNSTLGYNEYCSKGCISSDPNIKSMKEQKSLERFGTKTPAESKEIKEKIIKTNNAKYGANSAMCLKETQEKSKQTLIKNYGVSNPSESKELLNKRIESFKLSSYRETYKNTSLEKYGVEHPWKNKDIHDKSVNGSIESRNKLKKQSILRMIGNYKLIDLCYETGDALIKCDIDHQFTTTREFIYNRFRVKSEICTICNPICDKKSGAEVSLIKYIREIYEGRILENDRNIINPFEVDIYLPDLKMAFEYNGLWWHSSEYRESNYHFLKQRSAKERDIKLITIWEDEWIFRNETTKSFILNKIGKIDDKIFARNCKIEMVDKETSDSFLNNNHLSGKCNSSVRISLNHKDEIVCLVTFSKNGEGWELDRFCNKNYTQVIGGFSKILKSFVYLINPKYIITYSDNMVSDGDVYGKNGFKLVEELSPSYTLLVSKNREHRFYGVKENKTYPKIYNAGNKKWIWKV